MVKVRRFQPGNIRRYVEEVLEHRNHSADDRRRENPVANRERTLDPDQFPIDRVRREEIHRTDDPERERTQPDRDSNAESRADEPAPLADLKSQIDGRKSADQPANEQRRVDFAKKNAAP